MSTLSLVLNIECFLKAKTLNQLMKVIKENMDELQVVQVGDSCKFLILVSKDDRFYFNIMIDRLNSHCNRVSICDRDLKRDHDNKDHIKGTGYQNFTNYLLELKQQQWATA